MHLVKDKKLLFLRPSNPIREAQKLQLADSTGRLSSALLALDDVPLKDCNNWKGKSEKEMSQFRLGVIRNEW